MRSDDGSRHNAKVGERFRHRSQSVLSACGLDRRLSSFLRAALLRLQRLRLRPPAWVRGPLHRLLGRVLDDTSDPTSWDVPLIGLTNIDLSTMSAQQRRSPASGTRTPVAPSHSYECAIIVGGLNLGGLAEVAVFLAQHLPSQGIRPMVIECVAGGVDDLRSVDVDQRLDALGCEIVRVLSAAELISRFRLRRPDVISAHAPPVWAMGAAQEAGVPVVETLHGLHPFLPMASTEPSRQAWLVADRYIAVSALVRQQFLELHTSIPQERVDVVPNAGRMLTQSLDRQSIRQLLGLEREFLFVCLARYSLQKNIVGLVKAYDGAAARLPNAHLVIAGHVEDRTHFAQASVQQRASKFADKIHLRSHLVTPGILLAAADGFVLDSFFEGWALASTEALCAGVPVILSEVAGAIDQVGDDGDRGTVVPNPLGHVRPATWDEIRRVAYGKQYNTEELRSEMTDMCANRDSWAERRDTIRTDAQMRFSAERCAQGHARVLKTTADEFA